jgi:hypothetical protein
MVTGIFFFLLYVAEFWAFLFKVRIARIRQIIEMTNGQIHSKKGSLDEPGCMVSYAFIVRLVIRYTFMMLSLSAFHGDLSGDLPTWAIVIIIIATLFEVFNLMYSMFETRIFKLIKDDSDEKEVQEYWEEEIKWRDKHFLLLKNEKTPLKETISVIVLLISAFVTPCYSGIKLMLNSYL